MAFELQDGKHINLVTNIDVDEKDKLRIRDFVRDGFMYEVKKIVDTNTTLEAKGKPILTDLDLAALGLSSNTVNGETTHKQARS